MKHSWSFLFLAVLVFECRFAYAKATWLDDGEDLGKSRRGKEINMKECWPDCFKYNGNVRNEVKTYRENVQDWKKSFDSKDLKENDYRRKKTIHCPRHFCPENYSRK